MWVQRLKSHRTTAVSARWQHTAQTLARQLHIRRPVRLLESASVAVPTVIGWLRPVVLMPASALAGLSPEQLQAILAHELAHIRRHDYLVNLLQTLVETLLFYHPAVWWLSRRIRAEREHCCDDLAVSLCGDPYTYARALADLEGLRAPSVPLALAATGGSLLGRVRRLVIGAVARRTWARLAGRNRRRAGDSRRRPRCHRQRVASVGASLANGRVPRHARHLRHAGTSNQLAARGARSGLCGAHRRATRSPSTFNGPRGPRGWRCSRPRARSPLPSGPPCARNAIPHSLPYRPSTPPNPPVHPDSLGAVHARCAPTTPRAEHTQRRYRHQPDVVRRLAGSTARSAGRTTARSSRSASTGSSSSQTMISTSSGCRRMARSASPTAAGSPVTPSSSRPTRRARSSATTETAAASGRSNPRAANGSRECCRRSSGRAASALRPASRAS